VVAVTGDGTNDAPALKQADVGFAMFINGTQVAQKASDIVILDDNFNSIVQAVKWGRCVYDNICKFLQFQLTVNIVSCWLAMVGSAVLTVPPIGVLQLLWVNLIMDSFASLALATEDPNKPNGLKEQVLGRFPYKRTDALLSPLMVRNMIGHSIYQLGIILYIVFGMGDVCESGSSHNVCAGVPQWNDGEWQLRSGRPIEFDKLLILDYEKWNCVPKFDKLNSLTYYKVEGLPLDGSGVAVTGVMPYRSSLYDGCGAGHADCGSPSQHFTMVFHSFVFMQIFNEINARKLHNEVNVFKGLQHHPMFIYVFIGTIITQFLLVELPGVNTTFQCEHLVSYTQMSALLVLDWSVPHSCCSALESAVTLRYQTTDPIFLFFPPFPDLVAAHLLLRHWNSVSALAVLCCTLYASHDPPRLDVWGH
jgi:magnesium-transporting ATPase (P-type)